ncbi:DUF309 domain-containing protein [Solibacillus sp. FSL H8-0538]|uniref:DUF309 domain-containing protein n=1 Tax=Solibacillus sp. FSL H8-0538 TaxID=2921400 RepID=UPI0030F576A8
MHPLFHHLFVDYCTYFNGNEDYFECHEVLEEYWKEIAPGVKDHPLVGYVQLATGMYHLRRGNTIGAQRILLKAKVNFEANKGSKFFDYVDTSKLMLDVDATLYCITQNRPFEPFQLTLTNTTLQTLVCEQIAKQPEQDPAFLFNKHMLRDRSDILEARAEKLRKTQLGPK